MIRKCLSLIFILTLFPGLCFASDFNDGFIRLILNRKKGNFSLFYRTNPDKNRYESFFYKDDPSTSFLSVMVNDTVYKLEQSRTFKTKLTEQNGYPAIVYESNFLTVTGLFMPFSTSNSDHINGIKLTITIENTNTIDSYIGLRILLDTYLGEINDRIPFITGSKLITREAIVEGSSGETFWMSRGKNLSIMGSVNLPGGEATIVPDYIHFAGWKRLRNADWELTPVIDRSFNVPSLRGDSAVCYFYNPSFFEAGETKSYTIYLTTEDIGWYYPNHPLIGIAWGKERGGIETQIVSPQVQETVLQNEFPHLNAVELQELYRLLNTLNRFIDGEIHLNEDDLLEIERSINRFKAGL